ncbi:hypothetical protein M514_05617 [Trichuris suis]|uniref:EF hand n=1 Tax=Trichuris suis TaxID=68888 RepID=A0A085NQS2_9BILA|nr:hypothetical protein M513_05617 [Trichuris suis]KFD71818.1 hypothetical protein M514_05617 [Trichuris suis]KHJ41354.1 hypothetical protein D918_08584 [Trichuris suis]
MDDYHSGLCIVHLPFADVILIEVTSLFRYFGNDGGISIPFEQVGTVLRVLGRAPTEEQVNMLCDSARKRASKMYFDQFVSILSALTTVEESVSVEQFVTGLSQFNEDNSGFLKAEKLRRLLTTTGEKFNDSEVDDILRDQEDSNGNVNILKFVRHIMNC